MEFRIEHKLLFILVVCSVGTISVIHADEAAGKT